MKPTWGLGGYAVSRAKTNARREERLLIVRYILAEAEAAGVRHTRSLRVLASDIQDKCHHAWARGKKRKTGGHRPGARKAKARLLTDLELYLGRLVRAQ